MSTEQIEIHTAAIVKAVREYPHAFLDYPPVSPFATVRELMGCPPPSRLLWWRRRAWFAKLEQRVRFELEAQARMIEQVRNTRSARAAIAAIGAAAR